MGLATLEAVTDDIDIYRSAKLLVDRDGEDASIHGATRDAGYMARDGIRS